eukprot:366092-Chlamydomonas_euryale.AAC.9
MPTQAGRAVNVPVYEFARHARSEETRRVEPADVVILEGILVLAMEEIRSLVNMKARKGHGSGSGPSDQKRVCLWLRRSVDCRGEGKAEARVGERDIGVVACLLVVGEVRGLSSHAQVRDDHVKLDEFVTFMDAWGLKECLHARTLWARRRAAGRPGLDPSCPATAVPGKGRVCIA